MIGMERIDGKARRGQRRGRDVESGTQLIPESHPLAVGSTVEAASDCSCSYRIRGRRRA